MDFGAKDSTKVEMDLPEDSAPRTRHSQIHSPSDSLDSAHLYGPHALNVALQEVLINMDPESRLLQTPQSAIYSM